MYSQTNITGIAAQLDTNYSTSFRRREEVDQLNQRYEDQRRDKPAHRTAQQNSSWEDRHSPQECSTGRYEPIFRDNHKGTRHYSQDSNQFHAICLDTYPPIFYLNEFSKSVIQIVDRRINKVLKHKIAYTFDAGPHAFLIMHADVFDQVFSYLLELYRPTKDQLNARAIACQNSLKEIILDSSLREQLF